jgi:hypothetical protein
MQHCVCARACVHAVVAYIIFLDMQLNCVRVRMHETVCFELNETVLHADSPCSRSYDHRPLMSGDAPSLLRSARPLRHSGSTQFFQQ